jgi:hypothetical protein
LGVILLVWRCGLTFIIGVYYKCYRFDRGEMWFKYKVYSQKDEGENNVA